jgi:hypothetical protein
MPIFAVTIFLSAFLLFQVQPMIARMILPWFGGTAAVWATCLMFFQTVLLAGYLYSHGIIERLRPGYQWMLHSFLLALALFFVPITPDASWKPDDPGAPALRILGLLAATIGLPYFLLSTTGPLLQAWYVQGKPGSTPYRLFALSNLGSMIALVTYPPLIEPALPLRNQALAWSGGFLVFAVLCSFTGWRATRAARPLPEHEPDPDNGAPERAGGGTHALWILLAMCPSMLLLSITSHLSMDVAPIPFLWVLPLALYLLSFILCFDAAGWYRRPWFLGALPIALGGMAYMTQLEHGERPDVRLMTGLFALGFFAACMVCHGELARLKPHPRYLTSFYLMVSLGGALGGVFVALAAPHVFNATHEFPVSLAFCGILAAVVVYREKDWVFRRDVLGWPSILVFTLASTLTGYCARIIRDSVAESVVVARNFYGEMRVRQYNDYYEMDGYRTLVHGSINHGEQYTHPARRKEVVTYYCPETGIGRLMAMRAAGFPSRVGVMGLGAGTLAGFGRPGDTFRFYEINPLIQKIAHEHFTYLKDTAALVEIRLGDARLTLEREPPQDFDILIMDAFSSDSIPIHLITREAIAAFFRHLKPEGVLAVHISNRYINLKPVLAQAAAALGKSTLLVESDDNADGTCYGTTWVLMANGDTVLNRPALKDAGLPLEPAPWLRTWTDDYSNLFQVLK